MSSSSLGGGCELLRRCHNKTTRTARTESARRTPRRRAQAATETLCNSRHHGNGTLFGAAKPVSPMMCIVQSQKRRILSLYRVLRGDGPDGQKAYGKRVGSLHALEPALYISREAYLRKPLAIDGIKRQHGGTLRRIAAFPAHRGGLKKSLHRHYDCDASRHLSSETGAGIVNVILALSFERVSPLHGECRCRLG